MNRKNYIKPVSQVLCIDDEDIIATSGEPTNQTLADGGEEDNGVAETKIIDFSKEIDW